MNSGKEVLEVVEEPAEVGKARYLRRHARELNRWGFLGYLGAGSELVT